MSYQDNYNEPTVPYRPVGQQYQSVPGGSSQPGQFTRQAVLNNNGTPGPDPNRFGQQLPPKKGGGLRTGSIIALTLLLAAVFGTGLFAGWQFGRGGATQSPTNPGTSQTGALATVPALENNIESVREAVVAKVRPSVVQIEVATSRGGGLGSGVIIDERGYIVTNNHVIDGARQIRVRLFDGSVADAQLVGTDPLDDLAVVKINPAAKLIVASFGDSSQLKVGQDVLAVGNPLGNTQTVTGGIISALGRNVGQGEMSIPDAIQTDAPINPGNSGGALVDLKGNLVGIPTLAAIDPEFNTPANGVGFAIPSNRVNYITKQIIDTGRVSHTGRAVMGVRVTSVDPTLAQQDNLAVQQGVMIVEATAGGGAQKAGLRAGDVIVQVDNKKVTDIATLSDALVTKNPGDTVAVQIYRGNQQMTVNVTLSEMQAG